MNRAELWSIVEELEAGEHAVPHVITRLEALGAVENIHVGLPPEQFTEDMRVEWYAGQGLSMLKKEAWFAINSWINCLDKFCPLGPYSKKEPV